MELNYAVVSDDVPVGMEGDDGPRGSRMDDNDDDDDDDDVYDDDVDDDVHNDDDDDGDGAEQGDAPVPTMYALYRAEGAEEHLGRAPHPLRRARDAVPFRGRAGGYAGYGTGGSGIAVGQGDGDGDGDEEEEEEEASQALGGYGAWAPSSASTGARSDVGSHAHSGYTSSAASAAHDLESNAPSSLLSSRSTSARRTRSSSASSSSSSSDDDSDESDAVRNIPSNKDAQKELLHVLTSKLGVNAVLTTLAESWTRSQNTVALQAFEAARRQSKVAMALTQGQQGDPYRWTTRFQAALSEDDATQRNLLLSQLHEDFSRTAQLYGQLISAERYLPDHLKSIRPVDVGGVAGGAKYITQGILFKFAQDSELSPGSWLYGNSEENAQKAAGHELKGMACMFTSNTTAHLHFPLVCLVEYRGWRLMATSLLPIAGSSSLVYGSSDGGQVLHVADEHPTARAAALAIGARLNLAQHPFTDASGVRKTVTLPVDIEIHQSRADASIYYALDFGRVMPPELPSRETPRSVLYRLLRPEFVAQYVEPLSSDAFTGFGREDRKVHNQAVARACRVLWNEVIPDFASRVKGIDMSSIKEDMHRAGINMRYLGMVWKGCECSCTRPRVLEEMVVRTLSKILKQAMREASMDSRDVEQWNCLSAVADVFTSFVCNEDWWMSTLQPCISSKYGLEPESPSKDELLVVRKQMSYTSALNRLAAWTGAAVTSAVLTRLDQSYDNLVVSGVIASRIRADEVVIGAAIKTHALISGAMGDALLQRAKGQHVSLAEKLRMLRESAAVYEATDSRTADVQFTRMHIQRRIAVACFRMAQNSTQTVTTSAFASASASSTSSSSSSVPVDVDDVDDVHEKVDVTPFTRTVSSTLVTRQPHHQQQQQQHHHQLQQQQQQLQQQLEDEVNDDKVNDKGTVDDQSTTATTTRALSSSSSSSSEISSNVIDKRSRQKRQQRHQSITSDTTTMSSSDVDVSIDVDVEHQQHLTSHVSASVARARQQHLDACFEALNTAIGIYEGTEGAVLHKTSVSLVQRMPFAVRHKALYALGQVYMLSIRAHNLQSIVTARSRTHVSVGGVAQEEVLSLLCKSYSAFRSALDVVQHVRDELSDGTLLAALRATSSSTSSVGSDSGRDSFSVSGTLIGLSLSSAMLDPEVVCERIERACAHTEHKVHRRFGEMGRMLWQLFCKQAVDAKPHSCVGKKWPIMHDEAVVTQFFLHLPKGEHDRARDTPLIVDALLRHSVANPLLLAHLRPYLASRRSFSVCGNVCIRIGEEEDQQRVDDDVVGDDYGENVRRVLSEWSDDGQETVTEWAMRCGRARGALLCANARRVFNAFPKDNQLTELDLSGLTELDVKTLSLVIDRFPHLTHLNVSTCSMFDDEAFALLSAHATAAQLCHLDLSFTNITSTALHQWACRFTSLRTLIVRHCPNVLSSDAQVHLYTNWNGKFDITSVDDQVEQIVDYKCDPNDWKRHQRLPSPNALQFGPLPLLNRIEFDSTKGVLSAACLGALGASAPQLQHLTAVNCGLVDEDVLEIARQWSGLKSINLADNMRISHTGWSNFVDALDCRALECITIDNVTGLRSAALRRWVSKSHQLHTFKANRVCAVDGTTLRQAVLSCPLLRVVHVNQCNSLTSIGVSEMWRCAHLRELKCEDCAILWTKAFTRIVVHEVEGERDTAMQQSSGELTEPPPLHTWHMSSVRSEVFQSICKRIGSTLRDLSVWAFEMTDEDALCLAQHCPRLEALRLVSGVPLLTPKGLAHLATLRHLKVFHIANVAQEGAGAPLHALVSANASHLEELVLNGVACATSHWVCSTVTFCTQLRRLTLSKCSNVDSDSMCFAVQHLWRLRVFEARLMRHMTARVARAVANSAPFLTSLYIPQCPFTPRHLAAVTGVRGGWGCAWLRHCAFGMAGKVPSHVWASTLPLMRNLQQVVAVRGLFTDEGYASLAVLPNLLSYIVPMSRWTDRAALLLLRRSRCLAFLTVFHSRAHQPWLRHHFPHVYIGPPHPVGHQAFAEEPGGPMPDLTSYLPRLPRPRVVVVTGAAGGLGRMLVRHFSLEMGYTVVAAAHTPIEPNDMLSKFTELLPNHVFTVVMDVTDEDNIDRVVEYVREKWGRVDVLAHCAGTTQTLDTTDKPYTADVVAHHFRVNAIGAHSVTQRFMPLVKNSTMKTIVCFSGRLASITDNTSGEWFTWRSAKAALNQFSRCWAAELREAGGVSVIIHPGLMFRPMLNFCFKERIVPALNEDSYAAVAIRVAALVLKFTAADNGRFITYEEVDLPF